MQTFFWPSIIAVYVGVLLLLVDLWNHRSSRAFKIAVSGAMSIGLVLFSIFVVFRREPIRVSYAIFQDGTVNEYVVNPTAGDYRSLMYTFNFRAGKSLSSILSEANSQRVRFSVLVMVQHSKENKCTY